MKRVLIIVLLLMTTAVYAKDKPDIPKDKTLTSEERKEVKTYLKGKIFVELQPAKNDYVDRYDRGTVIFDSSKSVNMFGRGVFNASNYAFQKVEIPDGTTIKEVNFAQRRPYTNAIKGKDLTFIDCNLCNVLIDPTWTIIGGLPIQKKSKKVTIGEKLYRRHLVIPKNGSQWEEVKLEEITIDADNSFSPFDE